MASNSFPGSGNAGINLTSPAQALQVLGGGIASRRLADPSGPSVTVVTSGTTTFTYYVVAVDNRGNPTNLSPGNLVTTSASPPNNSLTWSAVAGAFTYDVLRKSVGGDPLVVATGLTGTSFTDTIASGSSYALPQWNMTGDSFFDAVLAIYNPGGTSDGNGFNAIMNMDGSGNTNITIRDLAIDGQRANTESASQWITGRAYAIGDHVFTTGARRIYRCITAGTATNEPTGTTTFTDAGGAPAWEWDGHRVHRDPRQARSSTLVQVTTLSTRTTSPNAASNLAWQLDAHVTLESSTTANPSGTLVVETSNGSGAGAESKVYATSSATGVTTSSNQTLKLTAQPSVASSSVSIKIRSATFEVLD